MDKYYFKKVVLILCIVLVFGLFLGTLIHEIGHGAVALIGGGKINFICVLFVEASWEGVSFNLCSQHGAFFGYVSYELENTTTFLQGLISQGGPLSTFLISLVSSFLLLRLDNLKKYIKYILAVFCLYFIDLFYSFLKLVKPTSDFSVFINSTGISVFPLLPIGILVACTNMAIIYFRIKEKNIDYYRKGILFSLLSLAFVLVLSYLMYFFAMSL